MPKQFHFLPKNRKFFGFLLFHWSVFTLSSFMFASVAVALLSTHSASTRAFLLAFTISSVFLIGTYVWYFREILSFVWKGQKYGTILQKIANVVSPGTLILADRKTAQEFLSALLIELEYWKTCNQGLWLEIDLERISKTMIETYLKFTSEISQQLSDSRIAYAYIPRSNFVQFSKINSSTQALLISTCIKGTVKTPEIYISLLSRAGITAIDDLANGNVFELYREINARKPQNMTSALMPSTAIINSWMERARQLPPFSNPVRYVRLVSLRHYGQMTMNISEPED